MPRDECRPSSAGSALPRCITHGECTACRGRTTCITHGAIQLCQGGRTQAAMQGGGLGEATCTAELLTQGKGGQKRAAGGKGVHGVRLTSSAEQ